MVVPCQLVVPVWFPEGVSRVGDLGSPEGMSWVGNSFLHCKGPPWEPRTSVFIMWYSSKGGVGGEF